MVRIVALHRRPQDTEKYEAYYHNDHMPLVTGVPGVRNVRVGKTTPGPDGEDPPYWLLSEVFFDDTVALEAAMASEEMKRALADVPNFATPGQVTIMICDTVDLLGADDHQSLGRRGAPA